VPQEVIDLKPITVLGWLGGRCQSGCISSRSAWRLDATLCAWRMYAARSNAPATHATARNEKSRAEACYRDTGPRWCASMRRAMLPNRDPERESRCLLLPRVALSNLGPPSCDSPHRPGLRVLLPLPMRASSSKQAPRDLKPTVEAWRLVATRDAIETYARQSRVSSGLLFEWVLLRG
jgi:hypothetical protein